MERLTLQAHHLPDRDGGVHPAADAGAGGRGRRHHRGARPHRRPGQAAGHQDRGKSHHADLLHRHALPARAAQGSEDPPGAVVCLRLRGRPPGHLQQPPRAAQRPPARERSGAPRHAQAVQVRSGEGPAAAERVEPPEGGIHPVAVPLPGRSHVPQGRGDPPGGPQGAERPGDDPGDDVLRAAGQGRQARDRARSAARPQLSRLRGSVRHDRGHVRQGLLGDRRVELQLLRERPCRTAAGGRQ